MDEVSHTSINVNVSAISEMYRRREKFLKAKAKAMEAQIKSFKEHRGVTLIFDTLESYNYNISFTFGIYIFSIESKLTNIQRFFQKIGLKFH